MIDDGRTTTYRGVPFRALGKAGTHCQLCHAVTHDYIQHANRVHPDAANTEDAA